MLRSLQQFLAGIVLLCSLSMATSEQKCDRTITIANLPAEVGSCRASIPSYFFNKKTNSCQKFIYGGCGGNANRFATAEECAEFSNSFHGCVKQLTCAEMKTVANLPAKTGRCRASIPSYFFNKKTNSCQKFIYGGCGGNANRFATAEECADFSNSYTSCPAMRR